MHVFPFPAPLLVQHSEYSQHRLPLHTAQNTRMLELQASRRLPPQALMQRAGLAVARVALAMAPHARSIWVACGPGNNGGDGLQAAAFLQQWGKTVQVTLLTDPERLPADARHVVVRVRVLVADDAVATLAGVGELGALAVGAGRRRGRADRRVRRRPRSAR